MITTLELKNVTVFNKARLDFSPGLNVLIGEIKRFCFQIYHGFHPFFCLVCDYGCFTGGIGQCRLRWLENP